LDSGNLVLTFVDSCCFVCEGLTTRVTDLWEAHQEWCKQTGIRYLKRRVMVDRLEDYFSLSRNPMALHGLLLKPEDDWDLYDPAELRRVYLISNGLHIKVGVSIDPQSRMEALQTGSSLPLTLLYDMTGGFDLEAQLHERYKDRRVLGEWFALTSQDVEEIARVCCASEAQHLRPGS